MLSDMLLKKNMIIRLTGLFACYTRYLKKNFYIAEQVSLFYCIFDIFNILYKEQVGVP